MIQAAVEAQIAINQQNRVTGPQPVEAFEVEDPERGNPNPEDVDVCPNLDLKRSPSLWLIGMCIFIPLIGVSFTFGPHAMGSYLNGFFGVGDYNKLAFFIMNHKLGCADWAMLRCGGFAGIFEFRRLIVANFLHGSFDHFKGNCLGLLFGICIESKYGPRFVWGLFLCTGIAGTVLGLDPYNRSLGASTICFGVTGGLFAMYGVYWNHVDRDTKCKIAFLLFVNMMCTTLQLFMDDNVSHYSHLGGFLGGCLYYLGRRRQWVRITFILSAVFACLVVVGWPLSDSKRLQETCEFWPRAYDLVADYIDGRDGGYAMAQHLLHGRRHGIL